MEKEEKLIVIYLAGALRGKNRFEKQRNMRRAERWAERLWRMGFAVYSPHLNSGWLDTPETDPHVIPANVHLMLLCDMICVMPNWENSSGTKNEIEVCKKNQIPVIYLMHRDTPDSAIYNAIHDVLDIQKTVGKRMATC